MAKKTKERKGGPSYDLDINLTPMIDVVFNLIIFFMVITDMTPKDLEYLILPSAAKAAKDEGEDKDRIIINIVNLDSKANADRVNQGLLSRDLPPILIGGEGKKILLRLVAQYADMWNAFKSPDGMREPRNGGQCQ